MFIKTLIVIRHSIICNSFILYNIVGNWSSEDAYDDEGYIIFDDVVLPKIHAKEIEALRSQWSGSDKKIVLGIGIVTCIYVTPKTHAYWVIDYRIYDKDHDGVPACLL